jgi:hypothetical protein
MPQTPPDDARAVFTDIYHRVAWSGGYPETVSGAGSTLESTGDLRAALSALLRDGPLPPNPTVLDAPCGDYNWFPQVSGVGHYIGMDIVEELVAANQRRHGSDTVRFVAGDLTRDDLPAADVLVCRDCLIHLSDAMVLEALANYVRSGIPLLLLTTHGNAANLVADATGGYRPINFGLPPYRFPEPLARLPDHLGPHEKYLALWTRTQVASALACMAGPGG